MSRAKSRTEVEAAVERTPSVCGVADPTRDYAVINPDNHFLMELFITFIFLEHNRVIKT